MSSCGSYTSLSFRSTPGNNNGTHRHSRHSPRHHAHNHTHHRHHHHNHHHGQNNNSTQRKHQVYYQTHHALCKRVFAGNSHAPTESAPINQTTRRPSHRRKSSSSSFNDSLRRRKRVDHETISFHGSGLSLFEPLHVDVSTPSTNTVILTPSKITIEHSSDFECKNDAKYHGSSNGRAAGTSKRIAYDLSPIRWSYGQNPDEVSVSNDRTDFIEIISEPEELCRSHCTATISTPSTTSAHLPKQKICRDKNCTEPKKSTKHAENANSTQSYSMWETECTDNNEDTGTAHTIVFHHKSDMGDKCCDNYCAQYYYESDHDINHETDIEMCISVDRSTNSICSTANPYTNSNAYANANMSAMANGNTSPESDDESNLKSNEHNCKSMSSLTQLDMLNNAMPSSSTQSVTNQLANFQKNNISQFESNRLLDLSSDIRRYSKITNFEQQNASNLLPNYFSCSSVGNLTEFSASNQQQTMHRNHHQPQQQQQPPPDSGSFELTSNVRTSTSTASNSTITTMINDNLSQLTGHGNVIIHNNILTTNDILNSTTRVEGNIVASNGDERDAGYRASSRLGGLLNMLRNRTKKYLGK